MVNKRSQMNSPQRQQGSPSGEDNSDPDDANIANRDCIGGDYVHAVADEFVDAMDTLDRIRASQPNGSAAAAANHCRESNYGIIERCGRWLMAIPRDDVVALQRTSEYREFLAAFDKLGEAHRRTVMLERQHLMEREDTDMAEYSANLTLANFTANAGSNLPLSSSLTNNNLKISASLTTDTMQPPLCHPLSPSLALRRRRYSFLQHLAVDDVLLRIFEFIDCSSLVRTGTTCHRFRELTNRSAEQRTHRLADGRLLRSAMKMLRAQEQIDGVGPRAEDGPFVPIPMLGLRRRVKVSGAGDAEYNGIYFCTGSNGNGFLFTKPRGLEQRVRVRSNHIDHPSTFNNNMQQLVNLDTAGGIEQAPGRQAGDHDANANNNDAFFAAAHGAAMGLPVAAANDEDDGNINGNATRGGGNAQRDDGPDVLFGDEPNRSRLLRCVIAKRFSNETILWYMSKEVEDETSHEILQMFSFWAKLLVTGDASPNVCQYPSQTSILSRTGEPAWQPLTNMANVAPPIVELLDGSDGMRAEDV